MTDYNNMILPKVRLSKYVYQIKKRKESPYSVMLVNGTPFDRVSILNAMAIVCLTQGVMGGVLVRLHEKGGDPRSDLLKDADGISYFDVNLPLYFERNGWVETKCRSLWGFRRLSERGRKIAAGLNHEDEELNRLLRSVCMESG